MCKRDEDERRRKRLEEEDKDEACGIGTEDRVHKGRGKVKITISRGKGTVGWTSCTRLRFISGKTRRKQEDRNGRKLDYSIRKGFSFFIGEYS